MPVDDRAFQAAADALIRRVNKAAKGIASDGAALAEASAKRIRSYQSRSGSNRRSIHSEPAQGAGGVWHARMGPSMVYSRRLELGGGTTRAYTYVRKDRTVHVSAYTYQQKPRPYIKPGLELARAAIRRLAAARTERAIRGQEV